MEDFTYHRPVLAAEAIELLAPRPGSLVLDGTCGGGGHTEAILRTGADVLALDQDPDAIAFAARAPREFRRPRDIAAGQLPRRRPSSRPTRDCADRRRVARSRRLLAPAGKCRSRFQPHAQRPARHADGSAPRTHGRRRRQLLHGRRADPNSFASLAKSRPRAASPARLVKLRKETPFRETLAAGQGGRENRLAATGAVIRRRRFSRRCGWK